MELLIGSNFAINYAVNNFRKSNTSLAGIAVLCVVKSIASASRAKPRYLVY